MIFCRIRHQISNLTSVFTAEGGSEERPPGLPGLEGLLGAAVEAGALFACAVGGDLLAAKLFGCVMMVMGPISCPFCNICPPEEYSSVSLIKLNRLDPENL